MSTCRLNRTRQCSLLDDVQLSPALMNYTQLNNYSAIQMVTRPSPARQQELLHTEETSPKFAYYSYSMDFCRTNRPNKNTLFGPLFGPNRIRIEYSVQA